MNNCDSPAVKKTKLMQNTEARDRLLKAIQAFLNTELIFIMDDKDNTAKMKKRVNYFADKITEMKKDL